jgi:serine/threonine protein kinase
MECMEGGDLYHAIRHGRSKMSTVNGKLIFKESVCTKCNEDEWTRVMIPHFSNQLLTAIEFIHSRQVIHCDLKPQNIVLTSRGDLKLTDFGSAICLENSEMSLRTKSSSQNYRTIMGTAEYASPEVIRGTNSPSFGIDLWSLGCILYAMWEGESPFQDATHALVIQKIMNHVSKSKTIYLNSLFMTESWKELVKELLVLEPSQRLGMNDLSTQSQGEVIYSSLRKNLTFHCENEADIREILHGSIALPAWNGNVDANVTTFRDGAKGWCSFLL